MWKELERVQSVRPGVFHLVRAMDMGLYLFPSSQKAVKYSGLESTLQQAQDEHPPKSPPPPAPSSSEHGKKH